MLLRRLWILDAWPDYREKTRSATLKRKLAAEFSAEYGADMQRLEWLMLEDGIFIVGLGRGDSFFELLGQEPPNRPGAD